MDVIALARELKRRYPGRDWLGQCERLCWNASWIASGAPTVEPVGYPSAYASYRASTIRTLDPAAVRPGETVWFDFPTFGHDGIGLGGGLYLQASTHGDTVLDLSEYGHGLKISRITSYPTRFLGAGRHGAHPPFEVTYTTPAGHVKPAWTATERDGIPGPNFWKLFQLWAREDGYTGPVDGKPGVNTWAAIQRGRTRWDGYRGPCDGVPGVNTWKALQRAARHGGYQGPIDGVPGKNTYRGLATLLNRKFTSHG